MPLQATSGAASYDAFGGGVPVVPNYIEEVFSTYLYTGNGSTQTITNNIDLSTKGGIVWCKGRGPVFGYSNVVYDTINGANKRTATNLTNALTTAASSLTAFNTTGFSLGADAGGEVNENAINYVSWSLRKQPKFFDVLTYTGTGSARTVAHNLGSVPGFMLIKQTSGTEDWAVYHRSLGYAYYMSIRTTDPALPANANVWNNTDPTSTVFSVGAAGILNASGQTYIAYLFAHDSGGFGLSGTDNVISCGTFTVDGSGDCSVSLGYEPQWIMVKSSTATDNWYLFDNMRGFPVAPADGELLRPNTAGAGITASTFRPTSTGFIGSPGGGFGTGIYIAIRRGPMKVPTSGTSVFTPIARTGTGATATVTGVGFAPDLAWIKDRGGNFSTSWDRLRGATKLLRQTGTSAEETFTDALTGFDVMDGVRLGTDNTAQYINLNAATYINWNFRRAPSFFDEVCWSGAGANLVINHNLQAVPELIINKYRNGTSYGWATTAAGLANPNTNYLTLNNSNAEANSGASPGFIYDRTSTTFTVSSDLAQSGFNWVSYLFASCPGVSKVGSYTGNGSTQTIDCGFTGGARFVLIKRIDSTGDWYVYDTARGMTVLTDPYLLMNSTAAEVATLGSVTTVSTGFALNSTILAAINVSAATYIFLAIA